MKRVEHASEQPAGDRDPIAGSPSESGRTGLASRWAEPALLWFLMLVGAIPVIGFAIGGDWYLGEVGVGTVFVIFAAWQLAHEAYRRRHHHHHQPDGHGAGQPRRS